MLLSLRFVVRSFFGVTGFIFLLEIVGFSKPSTLVKDPAPTLTKRSFSDEVSQLFCNDNKSEHDFWEMKLYDAQVEGLRLQPTDGSKLSEQFFLKRAKSLARTLGFKGYGYGRCAKGEGWVAAFPSSRPLQVTATGVQVSKDLCPQMKGYWAEAVKGRSKTLDMEIVKDQLLFKFPQSVLGYFVIECALGQGRSQELFFGNFGGAAASFSVLLDQSKPRDHQVLEWVNGLRKASGLKGVTRPPGELGQKFQAVIKDLAKSERVQHDFKSLSRWSDLLLKDGILLNGEVRSKSTTLEKALSLLWMSPRHRDLILDEKAYFFDAFIVSTKGSTFVTGLLARPTEQPGLESPTSPKN
jgi:hypothetical protein